MKVKGKHSESEILHAIILIVAGVLAIAVFIIVYKFLPFSSKKTEPDAQSTQTSTTADTSAPEQEDEGYSVDTELAEEMKDAAIQLISDNYKVLRLYYIRGLSHKDEPYGNVPEDGYYTVNDETYTSIDQLEEIVDRTFTAEFAQNVKTDPLGYGAIYKTRPNGTLGIIAGFTPMDYDRSWENPDFRIQPVSETACTIMITIHEKSGNAEVPVEGTMIKTEDGWRLTSILF